MKKQNEIKVFEDKRVRTVWDAEQEKWYISIVDVVAVLTDSPNPRKYWSVLKTRLKAEGSQLTTNCSQLKMQSVDGKFYMTDVADTEQLFRLIQSIPSPKAEPFKLWLAQVAAERLDEMQDPELSIDRALEQCIRYGLANKSQTNNKQTDMKKYILPNGMKKIAILLIFFGLAAGLKGQDITGRWNGMLEIQGISFRLVFHIEKSDTGYSATMDSPDQGATGIPVTKVEYNPPVLSIKVTNIGMEYSGSVASDTLISGTFRQAGLEVPMNLIRNELPENKVVRKQDPKEPLPYRSEEVSFQNPRAGITLSGTFTYPDRPGKYPAVVLVSGSGPQDRDEELLGHRPFLVLSDFLTRHGIAVLRYDDRGTAQSKGNFSTASTYDLADDAEAAFNYLRSRAEADPWKTGIVGHSEGGIIAPIVANRAQGVAFIVLMASPGIPGDQIMLLQAELISRAAKVSEEEIQKTSKQTRAIFDLIKAAGSPEAAVEPLTLQLKQLVAQNPEALENTGLSEADFIALQVQTLASPWMYTFIQHDPATELEKVKCPVLALNGSKDLQVPSGINLETIDSALKKGGNNQVTLREYRNLNHLFQKCKTGHPGEYAVIEQTISPKVMKDLTRWILKTTVH